MESAVLEIDEVRDLLLSWDQRVVEAFAMPDFDAGVQVRGILRASSRFMDPPLMVAEIGPGAIRIATERISLIHRLGPTGGYEETIVISFEGGFGMQVSVVDDAFFAEA